MVNRSPSQTNQRKIPEELFLVHKSNLQHLITFGCVIHTLILNSTRNKLDPKSKLCWLVGYDTHTKAYKLFNPRTKKVVLSHDITIDETCIGPRIHKTSQAKISSLEPNIPRDFGNVTWPHTTRGFPNVSQATTKEVPEGSSLLGISSDERSEFPPGRSSNGRSSNGRNEYFQEREVSPKKSIELNEEWKNQHDSTKQNQTNVLPK